MKNLLVILLLSICTIVSGCSHSNVTQNETQETVSNLSESENNPTELLEQETNTLEDETENVIITYVRYNEKDGTVDFDDLLIEEVKANLEKRGLSYAEHSNEILGDYFIFTSDLDNTVLHYDILDAIAERIQKRVEKTVPVKELNQIMYANGNVNTRSGDSTDYEKIGSLSLNQEVLVTGQSERTGWYRISVNGQEMFVSNNYLSTEKTVVQSQPIGIESQSPSGNSGSSGNPFANNKTEDPGGSDGSSMDWSNNYSSGGQVGSEDDAFAGLGDGIDWGGSSGASMDWSNNY